MSSSLRGDLCAEQEILHFVQNDGEIRNKDWTVILSAVREAEAERRIFSALRQVTPFFLDSRLRGNDPILTGTTIRLSVVCSFIGSSGMFLAAATGSVRVLETICRTPYVVIPAKAGIQFWAC